jgi:biopolymer transport protein ExbB
MRLFDYVHQGGAIMYLLILLNIVGISLILWRGYVIINFKNNLNEKVGQILKNVQAFGIEKNSGDANQVLKDEVSSEVQNLEYGLNTIKTIASISPLLGLLGTVIGILSAFKVIAEKGLSDPSLFAGGIAMALITTVGGLIVAIPHVVGYNFLMGVLDKIEAKLSKNVISKYMTGE